MMMIIIMMMMMMIMMVWQLWSIYNSLERRQLSHRWVHQVKLLCHHHHHHCHHHQHHYCHCHHHHHHHHHHKIISIVINDMFPSYLSAFAIDSCPSRLPHLPLQRQGSNYCPSNISHFQIARFCTWEARQGSKSNYC